MTEAEWLACEDPLALTDRLFFFTNASDRKFRLFSVACCQPILPHLRHWAPPVAHLLSLTEAFADEQVPPSVFNQPIEQLNSKWRDYEKVMLERYLKSRREGETSVNLFTDEEVGFWFVSQHGLNAAICGTRCAEELNRPESRYRQRDFYKGLDPRPFPFAVAANVAEALVNATGYEGEEYKGEKVRAETRKIQIAHLIDIFGNPFRPIALDPSWLTSTVLALANGIYEEKAFDRMPILANALQDAGCDNEDVLNHCRQPGEHCRGCWLVDLVLGKE